MVVYQMLLQLAMNMIFHFDGASMTHAQASPYSFFLLYLTTQDYVLVQTVQPSQMSPC